MNNGRDETLKQGGVREYLASVEELRRAMSRCMWEITALQNRCEHITTCLGQGTGSQNSDPHRDGTLAALADRRTELKELERRLTQREGEVRAFLGQLPDDRCQIILQLRYVELLRWNQVARRLEEMGQPYSDRQIFNLHRKGLAQAQAIWRGWSQLKKEA